MFSESTADKLSALTYRANAKRQVCWLPLAGIFWEDEMPDLRELVRIPEEDRTLTYRLFGIRAKLWNEETLSVDDQQVWDAAQSQVPSWALWQRRYITAEDRQAQIDVELQAEKELEQLFADADEVTITEKDGVQRFSATFKLREERAESEPKQSVWKRIMRKWR